MDAQPLPSGPRSRRKSNTLQKPCRLKVRKAGMNKTLPFQSPPNGEDLLLSRGPPTWGELEELHNRGP